MGAIFSVEAFTKKGSDPFFYRPPTREKRALTPFFYCAVQPPSIGN